MIQYKIWLEVNAVVSNMKDRIFCVFGLKMPIQSPREFGGRDPQMGSIVNDIPKGTSFLGITSYIVQIGTSVSAQLTLLANPQNLMLYNAFQLARHPQKCQGGLSGHLHPHVTYIPQTASQLVQPFCTALSRVPPFA